MLSYDTRAPRRNAATLSALNDADEIVVVGAGDPLGVQRLVRALGDLAPIGLVGRTTVVVNQVRASVAGPRPGEAITAALDRYAGVSAPHLVPEDRPALDSALLLLVQPLDLAGHGHEHGRGRAFRAALSLGRPERSRGSAGR